MQESQQPGMGRPSQATRLPGDEIIERPLEAP
jgi:hypothetical protein